ncbi:MAG: CRISPR-associated endonuclease Cas2 [Tyzzerella sp.]|uniref:CRISPR-associated endoribonuclease Cas2 n=1 Tax=Candidatus Fimicola merdigallinarum TaxID=2840819 RepID=A0A9D9DVP5_9FIRM|nr:CRISPR-associated endonuclease Cas2 [Candidatus Fimicola merdigallinarum]
MRLIVMFDLPIQTENERRVYRNFRKFLIKSGFFMMQESVYCKLAQNSTSADAVINNLQKNRPKAGLVQVLKITEKQYQKMVYITGESNNDVIDTDERLVIL